MMLLKIQTIAVIFELLLICGCAPQGHNWGYWEPKSPISDADAELNDVIVIPSKSPAPINLEDLVENPEPPIP
jgi:hypothetical protein